MIQYIVEILENTSSGSEIFINSKAELESIGIVESKNELDDKVFKLIS